MCMYVFVKPLSVLYCLVLNVGVILTLSTSVCEEGEGRVVRAVACVCMCLCVCACV